LLLLSFGTITSCVDVRLFWQQANINNNWCCSEQQLVVVPLRTATTLFMLLLFRCCCPTEQHQVVVVLTSLSFWRRCSEQLTWSMLM
jgi:hypothetical protein